MFFLPCQLASSLLESLWKRLTKLLECTCCSLPWAENGGGRDVGQPYCWFCNDPFLLTYFSMGGAIAVHTAERNMIPSLAGLVVIDVVEGQFTEFLFLYVMSGHSVKYFVTP